MFVSLVIAPLARSSHALHSNVGTFARHAHAHQYPNLRTQLTRFVCVAVYKPLKRLIQHFAIDFSQTVAADTADTKISVLTLFSLPTKRKTLRSGQVCTALAKGAVRNLNEGLFKSA